MVRREREGIAVKKAEAWFVVVTGDNDIRKSGNEKAPSQGCYGLLGRAHIRNEGRDDAADELAKAIDYQD